MFLFLNVLLHNLYMSFLSEVFEDMSFKTKMYERAGGAVVPISCSSDWFLFEEGLNVLFVGNLGQWVTKHWCIGACQTVIPCQLSINFWKFGLH